MATGEARETRRRSPAILAVLFLLATTLAVYWNVGGHRFVSIDDADYVYGNPVVAKGITTEGLAWAFASFHAANWHPLTWLSHMLDVQLFGLSPGWHHRVNVLFHLANTVLLFLVLRRMTGGLWRSAFVAALFGVHPLHVESVAWVSERKDVLSTFFWILTLGAYLRYVRKPGAGRYLPVAILLALGLLCKPMLVTLPFVLLLLDWWPLGRASGPGGAAVLSVPALSRCAREKVPLFLLSAASCAVSYLAQASGDTIRSLDHAPLGTRVANAIVSYAVYLRKTAWPVSLAVFYPHPAGIRSGIPPATVVAAVAVVAGLSILAVSLVRRRPYLAAGWLWYLGTLVPVIGLVQVGSAAMADRYTYVPLIGVFLAATWGIHGVLPPRFARGPVPACVACATILALLLPARIQAGRWKDDVSLFRHALRVTENNWLAWNNLGAEYARRGEYQRSIDHTVEALRIRPRYPAAWNNLGVAHDGLGRYQQSAEYYREAVRLQPGYALAWYNLGGAYAKLGRYGEAVGYFREAARLQPDSAETWYNLGVVHSRLGEVGQAASSYRDAVRIRPDYWDAWNNLGKAYGRLGRYPQAIASFQEALRIRPDHPEVLYNMGVAYALSGQRESAREIQERLARVDPGAARGFLAESGPAK